MRPTISSVGNEIAAAEPVAGEELIPDQRHTLVRASSAGLQELGQSAGAYLCRPSPRRLGSLAERPAGSCFERGLGVTSPWSSKWAG